MANRVILDGYNSDLNFIMEDYGYGGSTLNYPLGFRFIWAGARATHGVCKGKVFFEVKVEDYLDGVCDSDQGMQVTNVVRLGWSKDKSPFSLGEIEGSFGYGGTGKFVTKRHLAQYGTSFGKGDVIGAMLDLDSKPATMSFMKNGELLGIAASLTNVRVGQKSKAFFPHIFSKNCRVRINFGQQDPWYPPPQGFKYIDKLSDAEKIRGTVAPTARSDCEVILMIGLPGCGKTNGSRKLFKAHPEKCYNTLGTSKLLYQMKVADIPTLYAERWDMLQDLVAECYSTILTIAASRNRNYIIDQDHIFAADREKTLRPFQGFFKIAAVVLPDDAEFLRRFKFREKKFKKEIPYVQLRKMKANFSLPESQGNLFDRVDYLELPKHKAEALVSRYNSENEQYKS